MSGINYDEARKLALKEYKKAISRGESPYPVSLDEIISSGLLAAGRKQGLEQVPLALVIGTKNEGRNNAFARNFMPLLDNGTEFAAKWKELCNAHLNEGIREPVKVCEYRNRFYVEEGNKRVSVLKFFEADSIDAIVTHIPQVQDGSAEAELYDAFLEFRAKSGLRTIEFSKPESYAKLQELMGIEPGRAWTEDERRDFVSLYYYFHKEYVSCGGGGGLRDLGDALLEFIEANGYEEVCNSSPLKIKKLMKQPAREAKRILAVADDESKHYYEYYSPGKLDEFDLILACGDLHKVYLEFLTTMASCPVLYVRGNHDDQLMDDPPGGCICLEDMVYEYKGLRIAGLGGSYKYRDGKNMFTEKEMARRARKLARSIRKHDGIDILVTHAPARGVDDFDTLTHRGFEVFRKMLDDYKPMFMVHGHMHKNYGINIPQKSKYNETVIINAYEHCVFDIGGKVNDTDHNIR